MKLIVQRRPNAHGKCQFSMLLALRMQQLGYMMKCERFGREREDSEAGGVSSWSGNHDNIWEQVVDY